MPLFKVDDIKSSTRPDDIFSSRGKTNNRYANSEKDLEAAIGDIGVGETIAFATDGKWSGHHILKHMLKCSGPAEVYLVSWAITEAPVREILQLKDSGQITDLWCFLDRRVVKHNPNAWQLASGNLERIGLGDTHAKIIVVHNANHGMVCLSSQNLTNNIRFEAGAIISDNNIALEFIKHIKTKIAACNESAG